MHQTFNLTNKGQYLGGQLFRIMELIDKIKKKKASLNKDVEEILLQTKDRRTPLDKRWGIYTELVDKHLFYRCESYGDGFIRGDICHHDDLHIDRYQTVSYIYIYEKLNNCNKINLSELSEWKEKVLESGYSHFQFDW